MMLRLIVAATLIGSAVPAHARRAETSWGQAGVTFDQYRADAIACGRLGANADITGEPATKAFVAAQAWSDRNLNIRVAGVDPVREQALMIQRLRPEQRLQEVQDAHLGAVERCLVSLGYTRFTLTRSQARDLGRLRLGSPERHAFLHRLGSDPAVLRDQAAGGS